MRRSRDEPPADSHAPSREEVIQGFAVWRAGRSSPAPSPLRRPRRSLWAILTRRRTPNPYGLDEARLEAIVSELRETHPRFEIAETVSDITQRRDDSDLRFRLR